jgi:phage-related tail protein
MTKETKPSSVKRHQKRPHRQKETTAMTTTEEAKTPSIAPTETSAAAPPAMAAALETTVAKLKAQTEAFRRFAKEHPGTALAAAAGASALVAGEFAVGALVGVGAALLVTNKSGLEARREIQGWGRKAIASTRSWSRQFSRWVRRAKAEPQGGASEASATLTPAKP